MKKPSLLPMIMLLGIVLLVGLFVHGMIVNDAEVSLYNAAAQGDMATVERLVNQGVDINGTDLEWYPHTPLRAAAADGHTQVVIFLLNHHANINGALKEATQNGHPDVIRVLKEAGAKDSHMHHSPKFRSLVN